MISNTKKILTEALNPLTKITNSIVKKLNYIESSMILKAKDFEQAKDFIMKTGAYHSNSFSDLSEEDQLKVAERIYQIIHKTLAGEQNSFDEANDQDDMEVRIYTFLKQNGGIMYPLELSAKKLAQALNKKEDK